MSMSMANKINPDNYRSLSHDALVEAHVLTELENSNLRQTLAWLWTKINVMIDDPLKREPVRRALVQLLKRQLTEGGVLRDGYDEAAQEHAEVCTLGARAAELLDQLCAAVVPAPVYAKASELAGALRDRCTPEVERQKLSTWNLEDLLKEEDPSGRAARALLREGAEKRAHASPPVRAKRGKTTKARKGALA